MEHEKQTSLSRLTGALVLGCLWACACAGPHARAVRSRHSETPKGPAPRERTRAGMWVPSKRCAVVVDRSSISHWLSRIAFLHPEPAFPAAWALANLDALELLLSYHGYVTRYCAARRGRRNPLEVLLARYLLVLSRAMERVASLRDAREVRQDLFPSTWSGGGSLYELFTSRHRVAKENRRFLEWRVDNGFVWLRLASRLAKAFYALGLATRCNALSVLKRVVRSLHTLGKLARFGPLPPRSAQFYKALWSKLRHRIAHMPSQGQWIRTRAWLPGLVYLAREVESEALPRYRRVLVHLRAACRGR